MTGLKITITTEKLGPEAFKVMTEIGTDDAIGRGVISVHEQVCDLQERAIRDGLVALGWTPPLAR